MGNCAAQLPHWYMTLSFSGCLDVMTFGCSLTGLCSGASDCVNFFIYLRTVAGVLSISSAIFSALYPFVVSSCMRSIFSSDNFLNHSIVTESPHCIMGIHIFKGFVLDFPISSRFVNAPLASRVISTLSVNLSPLAELAKNPTSPSRLVLSLPPL